MPSMKPLSLVVTEKIDLSAETEHFDQEHAQVQVHTYLGYHISTPLLHKGALKWGAIWDRNSTPFCKMQ